jgi:MSHA pilin protein MshC
MSKPCSGFSLIELVVIIVIMGILTAYASSRINFASHSAAGYAEIIKSSIRMAQKLAIAQRGEVTVTFAVNPCNGSPVDGVQVTGEQCDPLPNGVTVTILTNSGEPPPTALDNVTFNGLGRPTNITAMTTITVSGGGDVSRVICLEPETGYVHEETAC